MHPILHSRVGADQFVNKISRLRENPKFKNVGPHVLEMDDADMEAQDWLEEGLWFDWPFVEFARNNYRQSYGLALCMTASLIVAFYIASLNTESHPAGSRVISLCK